MRLELTLPEADIRLPASLYLNSLKDEFLDNPQKGLRHPLAIYTISVNKAINSIKKIIELTSSYRNVVEKDEFNRSIEDATLHYLHSMSEHIDACDNIVSLVHEVTKSAVKNPLKDFKTNVKSYRSHLLTQANHIKHRQSQVRIVKLRANEKISFGYFIESATDDKSVGPDPIIHQNRNTAFSYSREMRLATIAIYFISKSLVVILNNFRSEQKQLSEKNSDLYCSLLNEVINLDAPYFPDEYKKPSCNIKKINNIFKISCGDKNKEQPPYGEPAEFGKNRTLRFSGHP